MSAQLAASQEEPSNYDKRDGILVKQRTYEAYITDTALIMEY
jgi:hypothetical protein